MPGSCCDVPGLFLDEGDSSGIGLGTVNVLGFGVFACDFDNDGWKDVRQVNGHVDDDVAEREPRITYAQPTLLFRNRGDHRFTEVGLKSGAPFDRKVVGRGAARGDVDNDGRPDVLILQNNGPALLWHNETSTRNHWVAFKLIGVKSNRDGISAMVTVTTPGMTQRTMVRGGSSYCSQSDMRPHFGLAGSPKADVSIRWPASPVDRIPSVSADRIWTVRAGAGRASDPYGTVASHQRAVQPPPAASDRAGGDRPSLPALLPALRHMQAETERINRDVQEREAEPSRSGNPAGSLEAAQAAVARNPNDLQAKSTLAGALVAAGKPDAALSYVRQCAWQAPRNVQAKLALADIYERLHHPYEAMELYRAILRRSLATVEAVNRLSWLYISFGWTADARALLEPAIKANPDDPHLGVELALTYLQIHDFQRCEQILLKIRRDHPAVPELWNPLVDFYIKQKLFPKAIAALQDSLKLRPGDPILTDGLADAFFESGDVSSARSSWQSVLSAAPTDVPSHYGLAECYRKIGNTAEAVRELETVMRRDPNFLELKLMLGQLYQQTGRAAEGAKLLREYQVEQDRSRDSTRMSVLLASRPRDPTAHFEMAKYYVASGKPERAVVELHRDLELNPKSADARRMLAELEHTGP